MHGDLHSERERLLLDEGNALRRLARGLLGGDLAEDLVQDTAALALAEPAATDGHMRPWLRVTLRNLATSLQRSVKRRQLRERAVARPELDARSDPAAIAIQAELLHDVAAAVRELDEPFCTVILLRFWRGLLPEAIAHELGIPRNTVRSRLQRGLDKLRARLDGRHGDRAQWSAPLGTLFGWRATVPAVAGVPVLTLLAGMLMKTKLLLAGAAVLLAALSIPFWLPPGTGTPTPVASTPPPPPIVADTSTPAAPQRQELPPAPPTKPTADPAFDASPVRVDPWLARFVVVDEDDTPVDDATITIWAATKVPADEGVRSLVPGITHYYQGHSTDPLVELHTAADGRASTTLDLEQVDLAATSPTHGTTGELPLFHTQSRTAGTRLVLEQPIPIRGIVRNAFGTPVARATVQARINGGSTLQRGQRQAPEPVTTDADGRFELPGHLGCSYVVAAEADGARTLHESVWVNDHQPKQLVLTFPGAITIRGFVLDADGQPVAKARVRLWREFHPEAPDQKPDDYEIAETTSAADGSFAMPARRFARYQLVATAEQTSSGLLWTETSAARPHAEVVLRLVQPVPTSGHVLHADGSPFADVIVRARPEQGQGERGGVAVPSAEDRFPAVPEVTTDKDGGFALRVHPGTPWTLFACPAKEHELLRYAALGVVAGNRDLRIVLDDAQLHGCRVRGTVLASDPPVDDCRFYLLLVDELTGRERNRTLDQHLDGDRFELPRLPLGARFSLLVLPTKRGSRMPGQTPYAPTRCGPFAADRADVDIQVQVQRWAEVPVRVLSSDGTPARGVLVNTVSAVALPFGTGPLAVDAEGRVVLKNRLPGVATITFWREQDKLCEQPLTLLPGTNPEVVVHLPAEPQPATGR